ncbi:MAG: NAD(P)/FAD-dependent oxidoreductase [Pseudomonadota bacterium]
MASYDAVIVGSGHNALACAVHLASEGWSVGVYERAGTAGGAIRTEETTLPGFRHDLYAMNLSLFAGSPFFAAHGEALQAHGLAFAPVEHVFATAYPDGTWFGVSKDLDATAARISAFSEADAARWRAMVAEFGSDAPYVFAVLGAPMTKRALTKVAWKAWREKGLRWSLDTVKLLLSSPREFLDANFESREVKTALAAWGMHLDFPPDAAGGALFPYLEAMANQSFGMVLGQGGADTVPKALVSLLESLGGKVHLGAGVAEIATSSERATGVILEDGERVEAGKAVIAGVAPSGLLKLLPGGTGQEKTDAGLRAFQHGPGTMMIHIAASDLPNWSASPELRDFAYVHLAPSFAQMSATYAEAKAGLLPREPVLVVGQPTTVDPSRAPAGQHTLWIQVRALPASPEGDAAGEIAPGDWDTIKEAYADRVMAIIERYAPGFGDTVLARTVHSPLDLERANPNLVGGDSLGGSHHLAQNFFLRPVPGMARYRTPVRGLHMVGASTWPGAGVGAGSGFILGKMLAGR